MRYGHYAALAILTTTLAVRSAAAGDGFAWTDHGGAQLLTWNDRPVLQYNAAVVPPPEGVDGAFARSAYIHPIWNTAGQIVTDDFPSDHYHQRGLFLAWTKTEFGNLHPDFWNLGTRTGRIVCGAIEDQSANETRAKLVVHHEWQANRDEEWVPVLNEVWRLRVYGPAGDGADTWVIDLASEQECATEAPLLLPQYHYGGMSYRGAGEWLDDPARTTVMTSEGHDRLTANETTARWCLMGGAIGDGYGGVTLMDHPGNVRFPTRLRVHPTVPYFGFMLPQSGAYTIEPGQKLLLTYRVLVHSRQPTPTDLNAAWDALVATDAEPER